MKQAERGRTYRVVCAAFVIAALFVVAGRVREIEAQHGEDPGVQISANNWGRVTAPVFGTSESGVYAGAELFAGPNKFGTYFSGVLPNGKIVTPAGTSIQVGMNPLGLAITSDGKYLVTTNDDERDSTFSSLQNAAGYGSAGYVPVRIQRDQGSGSAIRYRCGLSAFTGREADLVPGPEARHVCAGS